MADNTNTQAESPIDDNDFDVSELYPLMWEVFGSTGWNDPEMDVYDDYDRHLERLKRTES